jgi:hypothetical protein
MNDPKPSAARLREGLAADGGAMRAYLGEALYHAQVDITCQLLDVVDEVADPVTAQRITDAVCRAARRRWRRAAQERALEAEAETQRMAAGAPAARLEMLRYTRDNGGLLSPRALAELQALETLEKLQAGG